MRIIAHFQAMAANEILSIIPASEYERIKAVDPQPLFRAYVVGHEGESKGKVVGLGIVLKKWFKSAIQNLHDKIQFGLPIFHQHGETNAHDGRPAIGEIVGKAIRNIGDRLTTIAIAYIKPEFRNIPLDVASIEADFSLTENDEIDVHSVTGIALGNSAVNRPGFAGATLLAQLQAFDENNDRQKGGEKMTLAEIKKAIQEGNFQPSDLFTMKVLASDPTIEEMMEEKVTKEMKARGFNIRKAEDVEKEKEKWLEEKKALDEKVTTLNKELAKGRVVDLFEKAKKERKLDERQTNFIRGRLLRFEVKDPKEVEKEFAAHVDKEIDEYNTTAELFGIKKEAGADEKNNGDKAKEKTGAGAEQTFTGEIEDKYLDPAKNPFIIPQG